MSGPVGSGKPTVARQYERRGSSWGGSVAAAQFGGETDGAFDGGRGFGGGGGGGGDFGDARGGVAGKLCRDGVLVADGCDVGDVVAPGCAQHGRVPGVVPERAVYLLRGAGGFADLAGKDDRHACHQAEVLPGEAGSDARVHVL